MKRMTIDFGIDLGTTNSAIGVLNGNEVIMVKNVEGHDYTPSAVYIDKYNALIVGSHAKERLVSEPGNAYAEFKLQMGSDQQYVFERSGRVFTPEGLSAEVLKSLKSDVRQHLNEDVNAAIITVPAAFGIRESDATHLAAKLAGIDWCVHVTEPAAAAFAYGFQNMNRNAFWLVYDLGGGTFDAAVVKAQEGIIQIVNHGGDKYLGAKLIDWAIIDELLLPALRQQHAVSGLERGNVKHRTTFAKLKYAAEQAKIALSRLNTVEIVIAALCEDDHGKSINFQFDLKRSDVEKIACPLILKTVGICCTVLAEKRLTPNNIEKVLLVGGPTMTPYLRDFLADPKEGLGIPLEFSLDPLTVVARGAAQFAGTQQGHSLPKALNGQFTIELPTYKAAGIDPRPFLGGRVESATGEDTTDFTIEFINVSARPLWRTGKISLSPNGSFSATLWTEPGVNTFEIKLQDASGADRQTVPDAISYRNGIEADKPQLVQSVGLALADNKVRIFFAKGTLLPIRRRLVQKLAHPVKKGDPAGVIRLPVLEGEHLKADRNHLIGYLEVPATELDRDLPITAEVEISLEIDESRLVTTSAYIPMLRREFKKILMMTKLIVDPEKLKVELDQEKSRLEKARERLYVTQAPNAQPILDQINNERIVQEIETNLNAATTDRDAAHKAHHRLLEFKARVDALDDALEIPSLLLKAQTMIDWSTEVVNKWGSDSDFPKLRMLAGELRATMESSTINANDLSRRTDNLNEFRVEILHSKIDWWVSYFAQLEELKDNMTPPAIAERLLDQARRAITNYNIDSLKSACQQLAQLLPPRLQEAVGFNSSVRN